LIFDSKKRGKYLETTEETSNPPWPSNIPNKYSPVDSFSFIIASSLMKD